MSRSRDVRALILEEATRQFAAKGFDGTSLQAIADEVDITKPSLLYHYSSKAELREQVLEELLSHWN
ncbi:MAG: TetR/AcrR family transcriptional regulator, partial [Bradymonadaceae bacterium]